MLPEVCDCDCGVVCSQVEVMEVAIDKTGSAVERRLIFVDKNRDMFMTQVRVYGTARKTVKLC